MTINLAYTLTLGAAIRWTLSALGIGLMIRAMRRADDSMFDLWPLVGFFWLVLVVVMWLGYWISRLG